MRQGNGRACLGRLVRGHCLIKVIEESPHCGTVNASHCVHYTHVHPTIGIYRYARLLSLGIDVEVMVAGHYFVVSNQGVHGVVLLFVDGPKVGVLSIPATHWADFVTNR